MSEVRFAGFRVVETLGSGAISTIYKAVQEPLGRVVALKALKTQIAPTSSFGEQLDREAKILADLVHPNVVLLLDVGRSPAGRPYLVLEHVDGPSLDRLLAKKKKLPVDVALAIALGISAALEHVHTQGVVHRDVKPSNVLVSRAGVVKLVDFGIAQRARTASVSDALGTEGITPSGRLAPEAMKDAFGTPAYMSPEQILGDFVDGRSDLFSLGVVLYQMLSGSRPFEAPASEERSARSSRPPPPGEKHAASAHRIRRDAPAPLRARAPEVPRSVERLVMRLVEKAPDERFPNAGAVFERLHGELRAVTRDDPSAIVRGALVDAGFASGGKRGAAAAGARVARAPGVGRALVGQAIVLAAFASAAVAVEAGASQDRDARRASEHALPLSPVGAGGLRVVATPWAAVRVDGEEIDTTPFARAIPLSPGKHWVQLTHPDAPPVEREVVVAPGATVTLDVTMPLSGGDAGEDAK